MYSSSFSFLPATNHLNTIVIQLWHSFIPEGIPSFFPFLHPSFTMAHDRYTFLPRNSKWPNFRCPMKDRDIRYISISISLRLGAIGEDFIICVSVYIRSLGYGFTCMRLGEWGLRVRGIVVLVHTPSWLAAYAGLGQKMPSTRYTEDNGLIPRLVWFTPVEVKENRTK